MDFPCVNAQTDDVMEFPANKMTSSRKKFFFKGKQNPMFWEISNLNFWSNFVQVEVKIQCMSSIWSRALVFILFSWKFQIQIWMRVIALVAYADGKQFD